jgi:hypothetical protein
MVTSGRLAAVTAAVSGSPCPSQTSWILDPGLPRSTGFAPTWSPALGAHAGRVHAGARPVQPALLAEPVEDVEVEPLEHARLRPLGKPPPGGRWRAAAELLSRQQPPRGGGARHVDDRGKAVAVADGAASATIRRAGWRRQEGLDDRPQLVGDEPINKRSHGRESCQTDPKGAKRRLTATPQPAEARAKQQFPILGSELLVERPRCRPDWSADSPAQRAMSTGRPVRCSALWATLPSSTALMSEWPREPITINPASSLWLPGRGSRQCGQADALSGQGPFGPGPAGPASGCWQRGSWAGGRGR